MDTPILFIIFNRPDTTQRVFDAMTAAAGLVVFLA
jgi:hypothetical protein